MPGQDHLVIIGASVRAAAFSALRAGLLPWCVDLFADADLQARCPAVAADASTYPSSLLAGVAKAPPGPLMYAGALENHPRLIDALAGTRRLWGNDGRILAAVRSPRNLADIFHRADIPFPAIDKEAAARDCSSVLVKPRKGGGGKQIRFARDGSHHGPAFYQQEFIKGSPVAAIFGADGSAATVLGVTQMLVGQTWLHATPFAYCGSVGPLRLETALHQQFERIGQVLTRACGLRGLFGVDCIVRDGIAWPVEVNPRYTASIEVLEYATALRSVALQRAVFTGVAELAPFATPNAPAFVAKAILFARDAVTFRGDGPWARALSVPIDTLPPFADIPTHGQRIQAGSPILTLFARDATLAGCHAILRETARDLDRWLFGR